MSASSASFAGLWPPASKCMVTNRPEDIWRPAKARSAWSIDSAILPVSSNL